jgi:uncharacterized protein YqhQ
MPRYNYGGQALIEGVLMRGRNAIAVAVRHPDGDVVWETERLDQSRIHRHRAATWPFVRGLVILYEQLVMGTRWLMRAAAISASGEGVELGRGALAITLVVALGFGVAIFFVLPLLLSQGAATVSSGIGTLGQHLLEGVLRLAIFIAYLLLISRSGEIKRVFQYHGAEHMSIHAMEHDDPLTPEAVRKYPTAHQRCGTEFLLVVVVVSIFVFSLLAGQSFWVAVVGRLLLIPVIVSVSYEVLRWGAKHRSNPVVHAIFVPGIWLQKITTRQPDDSMIEVAIVSLQEALRADGEPIPEGSIDPPRRPMAEAEAATRERIRREAAEEKAAAVGRAQAAVVAVADGAPLADATVTEAPQAAGEAGDLAPAAGGEAADVPEPADPERVGPPA